MPKVLLINPPMLEKGQFIDGYKGTRPVIPPLGLAYIAQVLEDHGHKVTIFDGMIEEISMENLAEMASHYDFVGVTSTTFVALQMYKVVKAIKERNPDIPIIVGGAHATVMPNEVLTDDNVDYVIKGEGEYSMLDIVEGKPNEDIKGIGYMDRCQTFTPQRSLIDPLDNIPLPARHLLKMDKYKASELRAKKHPAFHMMSSRGCPHNCSFCSNKIMHRQILRTHSPERVVDEMELLIDKYGAKEIHFWDDNLALKKDRILKICKLIRERNIDIPWNCESRVDTIDPERLNAMKKAGCYQIGYGLESGSDRILKLTNKDITTDLIRKVIKWTNDAGIESRGYFMFGFVGETYEEMKQTLKFCKSLDLDYASFATLVPLPGSLDYQRAMKEGKFDPYYWKKQVLSDISFPKEPIYCPEGITDKQLISIHREAVREFYMRPSQILKKFKTIRNIEDIKRLFKGAYTILEASK